MKIITACLLLFMTVQSLHAQERLPILDVHLHAVPAGHHGPPPVAMCTPLEFPSWDPSQPFSEVFANHYSNPPCTDPVWSPETDEEMLAEMNEVMNRLNIIGVLSGPEPDRVAAWMEAAPGRFIPAIVLQFDETGGDFSPDSLRSLHAAGQLAVLGEVVN